MPNIKKPSFGALKLSGRKVLIFGVIILLIIIGFLFFHNHNKQQITKDSGEALNSPGLQRILNGQDYTQYQTLQDSFASYYIMDKQYSNAETVLNMVLANVPKDKIISKTYRTYWYLYQQNGDAQNRKKYALLTAEKLRQEGDPTTAAIFEKDANGK